MDRKGFSYSMISTDATRAVYEQMLQDDADRVLAWRLKGRRIELSILRSFAAWWIQRGPTDFDTPADAIRYRLELLTQVQTTDAKQLAAAEQVAIRLADGPMLLVVPDEPRTSGYLEHGEPLNLTDEERAALPVLEVAGDGPMVLGHSDAQ